jgi:hypothetical protein
MRPPVLWGSMLIIGNVNMFVQLFGIMFVNQPAILWIYLFPKPLNETAKAQCI